MTNTELLAVFENAERRIDADGTLPFFRRNLRRAFVLRGRYVKYLLLRLYPMLRPMVKEIKGETAWRRPFVMPATDVYGLSLACFGLLTGPDMRVEKFLAKHLSESDVFYDVGANYGFYSMLAEEGASKGEIHVFEPVAQVFSYLEKNFKHGAGDLSSRKNVFLNNVAVSETMGESTFYESYSAAASGMSTLREDIARNDPNTFHPVKVSTIMLDEYAKNHRPPSVIKMDIEGAEYKALVGARGMLARSHPTIVMEIWLDPGVNEEHRRAVELLYGLGYSSFTLNDTGEPEEISDLPQRLREPAVGTELNGNFVFQWRKGGA